MSHIYIKGPCAPLMSPSAKCFDTLQALSYTYITVKFQLRSSINLRLKESSLCNRFCTERSHKMGFWVDFVGRGEYSWWEGTSVLRNARLQPSFVQI